MKLEYENNNLRVENANGLRWQINAANKPNFSFSYDALSINEERAVRRVGKVVRPLSEAELKEALDFVGALLPPHEANIRAQLVADLRAFAYGLINSTVKQLEYDGLLHVLITGRSDSTDLLAEEARRVLAYVDNIWNAYYGLIAQIRNTPESELKTAKDYAEMIPFPPSAEHFSGDLQGGLLDAAPRKR